MLAGSTPEKDRSIDPDDFIGRRYQIKVEESDSGGSTRVTGFKPMSDDQAPTEGMIRPHRPTMQIETPF